jgi:dTDP-L-rhamnose 4-epimerase
MSMRVLVTGGAGFIGSYVVELLLAQGFEVRVFDSLVEQVHLGAGPRYVAPGAEFILGDVRDRDALAAALHGVDRIVHLAAEVGVGQSMYEIARYVGANTMGTANLLDILANTGNPVPRIVVASSMSVYGEGLYSCAEHGRIYPGLRSDEQLTQRQWDPVCSQCGLTLVPLPTAEDKPLQPTSIYAISKMDQELLCLSYGAAYGVGVTALRYFNAYGPRQAISNPYTGVAAIFSGRLLNGGPPLVFEDGGQMRDLIHVQDVARATVLALNTPEAAGAAINVGVGQPMTINDVARTLATKLGLDIGPELTGKFRSGDIRHCWANTAKAEALLGFKPQIDFADGMAELVEWLRTQPEVDHVDEMRAELEQRGLSR